MSEPGYQNAAWGVTERVEDLLQRMTLEEKVAQLTCQWSTVFVREGRFDADAASALIPHGIGQVTRIGAATGLRPPQSAELLNAIQRVAVERTRLGIPIFVHEEAVGGFCHRDATVFPQALGLAATWDPALVEQVAGVIRTQMLAVGARLALAPVLDVARDPRWGRVEETYGEDPVLAGLLGVAFVRGLQTADLRAGVAATGKHFLAYSLSEGGRNWGPVQCGPRELREVYAEPFAAAFREAGLAAIMPSYASIDGEPASASPAVLTGLLREELGFAGLTVSDYAAIPALRSYQHIAETEGDAARLALLAGMDVELPAQQCYGDPMLQEVAAGRVSLAAIDVAVRRVLAFKIRLGLFERPYVDPGMASTVFDTPAQRQLARQVAAQSVVVLTNDGILPLARSVRRVAVIGPGADDPRVLQGDYHYPAHQEILMQAQEDALLEPSVVAHAPGTYAPGPYYTPHVTPLAGLRAVCGAQVAVHYEQGCTVQDLDRSGFAAAAVAARAAELAIVIVAGKSGLQRPATVGEFNDATSLDLTGVQQELVEAVAATGTPLVVVVISGRVHTLSRLATLANALIYLAPPGEEGGNGLADVLLGNVNPSGRLPLSLPRAVGQVPVHYNRRAGGDRAMMLGDYVDAPTSPLFPFGHGLSYTTFVYSDLTVRAGTTQEPVEIVLYVANTGSRAGAEVVQLYAKDEVASTARPDLMLFGTARVHLRPGERCRLTFVVHPSRLAFFDPQMRFVTEPGRFTFSAGASSADLRVSQTVLLGGQICLYRQRDIVPTQVGVEVYAP